MYAYSSKWECSLNYVSYRLKIIIFIDLNGFWLKHSVLLAQKELPIFQNCNSFEKWKNHPTVSGKEVVVILLFPTRIFLHVSKIWH